MILSHAAPRAARSAELQRKTRLADTHLDHPRELGMLDPNDLCSVKVSSLGALSFMSSRAGKHVRRKSAPDIAAVMHPAGGAVRSATERAAAPANAAAARVARIAHCAPHGASS